MPHTPQNAPQPAQDGQQCSRKIKAGVTYHCRAGWAITLAGDEGKALEEKIGPAAAGALIYAASRPGERVPNFYASDEAALADIKACAARQVAP